MLIRKERRAVLPSLGLCAAGLARRRSDEKACSKRRNWLRALQELQTRLGALSVSSGTESRILSHISGGTTCCIAVWREQIFWWFGAEERTTG